MSIHPSRLVSAVALAILTPLTVYAFGWKLPPPPTFVSEIDRADLVLFGTLSNAQRDPKEPPATNKGTTDLTIEVVIKPHEVVKGKKKITIPVYVELDPGKECKWLIYFNVEKGAVTPYRGESFASNTRILQYLKGGTERFKDSATRLRHFFNYLDSLEEEINKDAFREFEEVDYSRIRKVAVKLPPDVLSKWLKDPKTRFSRYSLYGIMLGHCGKATDAKTIRGLLNDKDHYSVHWGMIAGYIMLEPQEGWDYLQGLVKDPASGFNVKYSALNAARFFWEERPDILDNARVLEVMRLLMDDPDISDIPMQVLRKWRVWDFTPLVLGYAEMESHNSIPINRRAILGFAIVAAAADPKNRVAVDFVKAARVKDAQRVEALEEMLEDEIKQVTPSP